MRCDRQGNPSGYAPVRQAGSVEWYSTLDAAALRAIERTSYKFTVLSLIDHETGTIMQRREIEAEIDRRQAKKAAPA